MLSQTEIVKRHLTKHNSITRLEALRKYGIMNLPGRIWDANREGFSTVTCMVTRGGKRFAKYVQG